MDNKYIKGFDDADKVLQQMPAAVEHRVLTKATRAGANVWRKVLRVAAPRNTGEQSPASQKYGPLFKNIKTQVLKSAKRKGQRGVRVTTTVAFWGYLLEFGTRFIAAVPWFRPTVEDNREAAEAAFKEALGQGVEDQATKLARKNGVR